MSSINFFGLILCVGGVTSHAVFNFRRAKKRYYLKINPKKTFRTRILARFTPQSMPSLKNIVPSLYYFQFLTLRTENFIHLLFIGTDILDNTRMFLLGSGFSKKVVLDNMFLLGCSLSLKKNWTRSLSSVSFICVFAL